jgi:hypothetical protein
LRTGWLLPCREAAWPRLPWRTARRRRVGHVRAPLVTSEEAGQSRPRPPSLPGRPALAPPLTAVTAASLDGAHGVRGGCSGPHGQLTVPRPWVLDLTLSRLTPPALHPPGAARRARSLRESNFLGSVSPAALALRPGRPATVGGAPAGRTTQGRPSLAPRSALADPATRLVDPSAQDPLADYVRSHGGSRVIRKVRG